MQSDVFLAGEGDRYHERNRHKYAGMVDKDPVLKAIAAAGIRPASVLEIGAATGWRLEELRKRYDSDCRGIEPSVEAVAEGKRLYPRIALTRALLNFVYFAQESFDVVILSFVLHWWDRGRLLWMLAEVDRMLKTGGYLIISDFAPWKATKVRYHHAEGVWTYKASYRDILTATGCYKQVSYLLFNADTLEEGATTDPAQGRCSILQKGDYYEICE